VETDDDFYKSREYLALNDQD